MGHTQFTHTEHRKLKESNTNPKPKTGGKFRCSGRIGSSCSNSCQNIVNILPDGDTGLEYILLRIKQIFFRFVFMNAYTQGRLNSIIGHREKQCTRAPYLQNHLYE